jgi:Uncharacterised nucleotidyltransferase
VPSYGRAAASEAAPLGRLSAVLRACTPEETDAAIASLASLEPIAAQRVITLADAHGVAAWLAHRLPDEHGAWQVLAQQRTAFTAAYVRDRAALREIGRILAAIDCPWVLLKGRALAEQFYPRPDMRFGVDIDVLVAPAHYRAAIEAFAEAGWRLIDLNWPLAARIEPGELRVVSPTGILVDLHWHLLAPAHERRYFQLPTGPLLDRRVELASGVPALDPVDQLVHLGIHGSLSGGNRLQWLLDCTLAARSVTDWDEIGAAAGSARAGVALSIVLLRAQKWLGAEIPRSAWAALGTGAGLRTGSRLVDRLSPLGDSPYRPSLSRVFARAAKATTGATGLELVRRSASFAAAGRHRDPDESPSQDPNDPRSPLFVADDARARDAYFELVAQSG